MELGELEKVKKVAGHNLVGDQRQKLFLVAEDKSHLVQFKQILVEKSESKPTGC